MASPFLMQRRLLQCVSAFSTVSRRSTNILLSQFERRVSTSTPSCKYDNVSYEIVGEKSNVALIHLTSRKTFNSLGEALLSDLSGVLDEVESEKDVGAIVLTGKGKAFAAGADIKAMQALDFPEVMDDRLFLSAIRWDKLGRCRKPTIAAVNGYAFGGGMEMAMLCDIIYASEKARFGQLEILLGAIPGGGGTQRLPKSVGKSKAMEMCLTGEQITAEEALQFGLVSKVFPADDLVAEAVKTAEKIAGHSKLITQICKEAVNCSFEMTLAEGNHFEKRLFHSTFATHDRKEGMSAFVEKRKANFRDR